MVRSISKRKISLKSIFNSFCVAILLCANPISWTLSSIDNVIVLIIGVSFAIIMLLNLTFYIHYVNKKSVLIVLLVLFYFIFSIIRYSSAYAEKQIVLTLEYFLCFGFPALIISQLEIDYKQVMRIILLLSLLLLPFVRNIDFGIDGLESVDTGMWMGVSYGILCFINVAIFTILFDHNYLFKVASAISLVGYLGIQFSYGSRGAILSSCVCLVLSFFLYKRYSITRLKKKTIVIISLFVLLIPAFKWIFNIVLKAISQKYDIYFVNKMLDLMEARDVLNGRDSVFDRALNGIADSPVFGNGISHFGNFSGEYPHNLFLQLMYEGGIILLIPFILLILKALKIMFSTDFKVDVRIFVSLLFCTSVIQLLFSSTYWESQIFWFLIGTTIKVCYPKFKLSYSRL